MSYATNAAALPNKPTPAKTNKYLSTSIVVSFPFEAFTDCGTVLTGPKAVSHRLNRLSVVTGVGASQLARALCQLRANNAVPRRGRTHRPHRQLQHRPLNRRRQSQSTNCSHRQNRHIEQSNHVRLLRCAEQIGIAYTISYVISLQ
jgi:hypothetical protein